jgi:hypothetical protein
MLQLTTSNLKESCSFISSRHQMAVVSEINLLWVWPGAICSFCSFVPTKDGNEGDSRSADCVAPRPNYLTLITSAPLRFLVCFYSTAKNALKGASRKVSEKCCVTGKNSCSSINFACGWHAMQFFARRKTRKGQIMVGLRRTDEFIICALPTVFLGLCWRRSICFGDSLIRFAVNEGFGQILSKVRGICFFAIQFANRWRLAQIRLNTEMEPLQCIVFQFIRNCIGKRQRLFLNQFEIEKNIIE